MFRFIVFVLMGLLSQTNLFGQSGSFTALFDNIVVSVDTNQFSSRSDMVFLRGERHLAFKYTQEEQVVVFELFPRNASFFGNRTLSIIPSADFDILDSMAFYDGDHFQFRVRFKNISRADFSQIGFNLTAPEGERKFLLKLLPYTETKASFNPGDDYLYIGEEKQFEINTNQLANLNLDGVWKTSGEFEYRLFERNGTGYISLVPLAVGAKTFDISFETKRPQLSRRGASPSYTLEPQTYSFLVKGSRLSFLRFDAKQILVERDNREGFEMQIDNHRNLKLQKTYRIEDREEPGGPLIAEIFTVRALSNDKVICVVRPYLFHQPTDGYLYIKDGDTPQFITNITISPEPSIETVSILREGKDWATDRIVRPGETIEVKIEGQGLDQARFYFEDLELVRDDSLTRNANRASYKLRVPVNIVKRRLEIYNGEKKTNQALFVREYERPRPLDFVKLNYGDGDKVANTLNQPILYPGKLNDIVLKFDYNAIDEFEHLYGRQHLEVDVRITGKRGELIEMQKIDFIQVCPGDASPRSAFYQGSACNLEDMRINQWLSRKFHSLDEWSRIELVIRHDKEKYGGEGYEQRVVIYLQRLVTFDVELSFPAGLVIKKVGEDGFPGLTGVSLAMLAQFSFYEKESIRRFKPYKIGAGFLAQNAFNFNPENQDRDLGIVILGSVYPTRRDAKLSFPLYAGAGYFLNAETFFFLIGPGIRITL